LGEQVNKIIRALSSLESDIDSLHKDVLVMQNDLKSQTKLEIEKLTIETQNIANEEAQKMISDARDKAKLESDKIIQDGENNILKLKRQIDNSFDEVVDHIFALALK